ncbi:MAG: hypothetical protein SWO11_00580 [Thermodesulfobacteriota bacterium]|nr:hypothetical protein [Thermodesulfobacteriota bacterium]
MPAIIEEHIEKAEETIIDNILLSCYKTKVLGRILCRVPGEGGLFHCQWRLPSPSFYY